MHIGQTAIHRRKLLKAATFGTALSFTPAFYQAALAAPATQGDGPYGPLQAPDAHGVALPAGFTSRVIATSGLPVLGVNALTGAPIVHPHVWHPFPDGAACYPDDEDGYFYVNNAEVAGGRGGASGLHFNADGQIIDAYPILEGTSGNCAGGATPWGTWMSCEENGDSGRVWECSPSGTFAAYALPFLGRCNHEAIAVDPVNQTIFVTEDNGSSNFYRYTMPAGMYADAMANGRINASLADPAGGLEAALVDPTTNAVTWLPISDYTATPLRNQGGGTQFRGTEGIWYDSGFVYFTTKGDNRVWVHDILNQTIEVLYDPADFPTAPLTGVDNVTIAPSGDVLIAEDGGDLEIRMITADKREVAALVRLPGGPHAGSEITGPCFSPDGTKLYFSSQRGGLLTPGAGITFEISGPFRTDRVAFAATGDLPEDARFDPAPHSPATEGANNTEPRQSSGG